MVVCRVDRTGELCWSGGTCVVAGSDCAVGAALHCVGRRAGFSMERTIPSPSQGTSVKKESLLSSKYRIPSPKASRSYQFDRAIISTYTVTGLQQLMDID
jgi:hypothetical protein